MRDRDSNETEQSYSIKPNPYTAGLLTPICPLITEDYGTDAALARVAHLVRSGHWVARAAVKVDTGSRYVIEIEAVNAMEVQSNPLPATPSTFTK